MSMPVARGHRCELAGCRGCPGYRESPGSHCPGCNWCNGCPGRRGGPGCPGGRAHPRRHGHRDTAVVPGRRDVPGPDLRLGKNGCHVRCAPVGRRGRIDPRGSHEPVGLTGHSARCAHLAARCHPGALGRLATRGPVAGPGCSASHPSRRVRSALPVVPGRLGCPGCPGCRCAWRRSRPGPDERDARRSRRLCCDPRARAGQCGRVAGRARAGRCDRVAGRARAGRYGRAGQCGLRVRRGTHASRGPRRRRAGRREPTSLYAQTSPPCGRPSVRGSSGPCRCSSWRTSGARRHPYGDVAE